MIATMHDQTRKNVIKLCVVLSFFALLTTLLGVSIRYKRMLEATISNQEQIVGNMARMRMATKEVDTTIASFNRLLPAGYGSRSPEWLLYSRLDELKSRLQADELTVKPLETKDGLMLLNFSAILFAHDAGSYNRIISLLGRQETLAFPFMTIHSIAMERSAENSNRGIKIIIEGAAQTPAPQPKDAAQ